jgi:magnesium-transporting ATPase (P-type)
MFPLPLQVEMSSLTGEPRPVVMRVLPEETESVVHAHNIGFSSSLVITGEGIGVVTR